MYLLYTFEQGGGVIAYSQTRRLGHYLQINVEVRLFIHLNKEVDLTSLRLSGGVVFQLEISSAGVGGWGGGSYSKGFLHTLSALAPGPEDSFATSMTLRHWNLDMAKSSNEHSRRASFTPTNMRISSLGLSAVIPFETPVP